MNIRTTGILIKDNKILLLDQNVNEKRSWSLPGGKVDPGETIGASLIREMKEETGLDIKVGKLLYVCDLIKEDIHIIHMTFLVEKIGGVLGDIAVGLDTQKIRSVEMVPITDLEKLGFSLKFKELVENNFPSAGNYMGAKNNIGL